MQPADLPYEIVRVKGEGITPSLLVWRRYKRRALTIVEELLDLNPHVAEALSESPYLPIGAIIRMPIDRSVLNGDPVTKEHVRLWGKD